MVDGKPNGSKHFKTKLKQYNLGKQVWEKNIIQFSPWNRRIDVCETNKYLDIVLNEHLGYTEAANALSVSAGRALSSLIVNLHNKFFINISLRSLCPSVWGRNAILKQIL